jgi:hypothetical protein
MRRGGDVAYLRATPKRGIRSTAYVGDLAGEIKQLSDEEDSYQTVKVTPGTLGLQQVDISHHYTECFLYVSWPRRVNLNHDAPENEKKESERFKAYTHDWMRYFVEMYKFLVGDSIMGPYDPKDVDAFVITELKDGVITPDGVVGELMPTSALSFSIPKKLQAIGAMKGSPDRLEELNKHLKAGSQLGLVRQLILDARDQANIFRRYDIAIIIAGTSFEVFLKERLVTICRAIGRTSLEVGKGKGKRTVGALEYAEMANPQELLAAIQSLLGIQIKGAKVHSDWYVNAYEPRNNIIHRGTRDYGEVAADKAIEVVTSYIAYINSIAI